LIFDLKEEEYSIEMSTRKQLQQGIYRVINPLVRVLIRAGLTPNMVTTIGLVLNIGVAIIFIEGAEKGNRGDLSYVGWAGALILFAGLFDMLDGQVARLGNMSSRFGALYDSVLDRYSELILFLGICYYLVAHHYFLSSLFAFIGLMGSMMVSYTRARAEGLGIECKDGLMQRPERVILVGVSALACGVASRWMGGNYKVHWPNSSFPMFETISIFTIPITVMAVLANATAISRLINSKKALEEQEKQQQSGSPVKKASIFLWLMLLLSAIDPAANAQKQKVAVTVTPVNAAVDSFPIPPHKNNSLFYLQRTPNINTIICELNEKNGVPDPDDPVHVLWIRYTEQKQRQELNFIQRHFAYGIRSQRLGNGDYELHFVSYKKLPMYLRRSPVDNLHHVYVNFNKKQILLNRVFIKINPGGSFWSPNVEYLEFRGIDPDNGKELMERVKI
jgi:phosphatidylglycerophosphate synthase